MLYSPLREVTPGNRSTMATPPAAPDPVTRRGLSLIDAGPGIGPLQRELIRVLFLVVPFLTPFFLAGDGVR